LQLDGFGVLAVQNSGIASAYDSLKEQDAPRFSWAPTLLASRLTMALNSGTARLGRFSFQMFGCPLAVRLDLPFVIE